jgi:hypothetical protein
MFTDKIWYVLQDANGNLIGKDQSSGGYPWVPDYPSGVWYSQNFDELRDYNEMFKNVYKIVQIEFKIVQPH